MRPRRVRLLVARREFVLEFDQFIPKPSVGSSSSPVDPQVGPIGEPLMARVAERDRSVVTDAVTLVSTMQMQLILPKNRDESGSLFATLRIGPGGADAASLDITCAS